MEGEMETVNITRLTKLKENLENFKELLTSCNDVLTWKKDWFPGAIIGVVTVVFMFLWWNEITVLTSLSILGAFLICLDVACMHGRKFIASIVPWNPQREREFTDICITLSQAGSKSRELFEKISAVRAAKPGKYYLVTSIALLIAAWIGGSVPNLMLCYWTTIILALMPGAVKTGLLQKYVVELYPKVWALVSQYLPAKKPAEGVKED